MKRFQMEQVRRVVVRGSVDAETAEEAMDRFTKFEPTFKADPEGAIEFYQAGYDRPPKIVSITPRDSA